MSATTASERSRPDSLSSKSARTHLRYEPTMSTIFSEPGDLIKNARMRGHNAHVGKGVWSLSKRVAQKPYQPRLRDVYPRSEYTMMSTEENAPKFFDGRFLTYDYRDMIQQNPGPQETSDRPVVYKTKAIESVQTKKKYNEDVRGKSYLPLHIGNDTTAHLFQRSLHRKNSDPRYHPQTGPSKAYEISGCFNPNIDALPLRPPDQPIQSFYPALDSGMSQPLSLPAAARLKNLSSSVFPLGNAPLKIPPIPTTAEYMTFGEMNLVSDKDDTSSKANSKQAKADWMSEWFPRADVANTMRFMGKRSFNKADRNREYVINFHGLQ